VTLPCDIAEYLLAGLPVEVIRACYAAAPGNDIESRNFASPESSAALVANAFGFFLIVPQNCRHSPIPAMWNGREPQ
jgi:hypothetical protein